MHITLAHTQKTAEEEFAELDAKIARLLDLVRQLRTRRNAIPSINQLPRELLREIMHHVKEDTMTAGRVSNQWVKVAQVCQHWRDVALGSSTLWTTIVAPPARVEWIEELCKRSRSAPLSLVHIITHRTVKNRYLMRGQCEFSVPDVAKIGSLLRAEMHRIRGLHLSVAGDPERDLLGQLTDPAPLLEHLKITGCYGAIPTIPPEVFSGQVPNLRRLQLEECAFNRDSPLLAETLQDLRIISPAIELDVDQFTRILTSLPRLCNLELESALPKALPYPLEWSNLRIRQGHIQIPSLRTLSISYSRPWIVGYFISLIQLHDTLSLRLHPTGCQFDKFLDHVASPLLHDRLAGVSHGFALRVSAQEPRDTAGLEELTIAFSTPSSDHIWFEISTQTLGHGYTDTDYICALIDKLPLENLQEFAIGHAMLIQMPTFRKLSLASRLETIVLEGNMNGVVNFVWNLNNAVSQCPAHTVSRKGILYLEKDWLSENGSEDEDEWGEDSDGEGSFDADEHSSNGEELLAETGSWDTPQDPDSMDERGHGADRGIRPESEPETDNDEEKYLQENVGICEGCAVFGESFFPALRNFVVRDVNLNRWWIASAVKMRVHPIAEFVLQRIRCGLPIETITFKPRNRENDWSSSESHMQSLYRSLCKDKTPIIRVVHCSSSDGEWDMARRKI
ncbi:hypothetical protein AX16_003786 [Volvariella volvacea WC 439]|nr:hypothetical protein AX16_003786 [Volvariella volvacea WC 439]